MQRIDGRIVLSPTDLTKHVACPHITTLDRRWLEGDPGLVPSTPDDALQLIFTKGNEHEAAYLEHLRDRGLRIVEIARAPDSRDGESATLDALRSGADVVYQGTFFDGSWIGHADFLLKRPRPSLLGSFSYDIADTKLARRLKVPALLQMATYAERLTALQGVAPRQLVVVTGDRREHVWRLVDVADYAQRLRRRLADVIEHPPSTEAVPVQQCGQCRWHSTCAAGWEASDDLCQVAGLRADHRQALRLAGISTMDALARRDPGDLVGVVSSRVRDRLVSQAALQVRERETGEPAYELLEPVPGLGLQRLPQPCPSDVYLDFEGDPWAQDGQGREYLAGLWDRSGGFSSWWAHSPGAEQQLIEDLVDDLTRRRAVDPSLHVYHYAAYEVTALKRLTGRYGTREAELDQLLRAEVFVDLYAVVKHGLRISKPSYSIKKLEDFYWTQRRDTAGVADAMTSVVEYERYLVTGDATILARIEDYNRDDVRSTHDLHEWLELRRDELSAMGHDLTRPGTTDVAPVGDEERAEAELAQRLLDDGHPLLAGCVGWHRREARPAWWDYFRYADLDTEALVENASTVGGPSAPVFAYDLPSAGAKPTSKAWRYTFAPQDVSLRVGDEAHDVDARKRAGTLLAIDARQGWLELKLGVRATPPVVRALGPKGPVLDGVLRQSIARAGEHVLSGRDCLGDRLVRRVVPEPAELTQGPDESAADVVVRVGRRLEGTVLAVQGPPGSGKTHAAARLIRALLDDGKRVGVTALSHAVIGHVLAEVGRPAMQKVSVERGPTEAGDVALDPSADHLPLIRETTNNAAVAAELAAGSTRLVGGTAWLWAREEMAASVDVLVIDEAGQFSLANAVAVAGAARSLVLLGDPQQLTQPTNAYHPYGANVSALEHFVGGADTIAPDRGVFLDQTWRMHPSVCAFVSDMFYDGRLTSAPGLDRIRVHGTGRLDGAGLRWVPVSHEDAVADNPAEVAVVAALVDEALGGGWTDHQGRTAGLAAHDILVVAPYNAQVELLRAGLPDGVRVGTVDKLQGQQGTIVIYSMTSSSAAVAPRGVEFLYDVHRFNVALSRAKALSMVVGSPRLLEAAVHTPSQLRAVNALCRYVALAQPI